MLESTCQASVPRDAFPPTPPGPEGSNGNGLLRVQWVSGAWQKAVSFQPSALSPLVANGFLLHSFLLHGHTFSSDLQRFSLPPCTKHQLKLVPFSAEEISMMPSRSYVAREQERPEDHRRFLFSAVPMWIFDRKTLEILEVNDAATETYGYSRTEFLKMTILDFRPSEDIPKVLQSALGAPGSRPSEPVWRHRKKDGTVFPAKVLSWQITFDGHQAALVLAEAVRAASAQNWPGT